MVVSAKYLIILQLGDYPSHDNPKNASGCKNKHRKLIMKLKYSLPLNSSKFHTVD